MVDNVNITPGTGKTMATDDISSVHYQRHKLIHGDDGTNDGDVSRANGLPIAPARCLAIEDVVEVAHGSITSSFVNTSIANISTNTHVHIINNTNGDLYFRWLTLGNAKLWVPAYSSRVVPIPASAAELQVKYDTDPDTGKLVIEVLKG